MGNVANMSFGTRRRSDATSYKPKGKKMMKVVVPKLSKGWVNYGLGYGSANVKVQGFLCMVSGVIHGANFGLLATLPAQCRPKKSLAFMLNHHYDIMRVNVHPDGTVMWAAGSTKHRWVSLSGITFSTSPHHAKMKMENGWIPFDKEAFSQMLSAWSATGSRSESDLFTARAVLGYLVLKNVRDANILFAKMQQTVSEPTPLHNFLRYLLMCITRDAAPLYEELCKRYQKSLGRDNSFAHYIEVIGAMYFKIAKPQNPMQQMMQQMMGGMMG